MRLKPETTRILHPSEFFVVSKRKNKIFIFLSGHKLFERNYLSNFRFIFGVEIFRLKNRDILIEKYRFEFDEIYLKTFRKTHEMDNKLFVND